MSLTRSFEQDAWSVSENGKTILTVRETEENGTITVCLSGALRSDTEHMFKDELVALMSVGMNVVLDCGELEYIASACQDALLSVQQMADSMGWGSLTLRKVPPAIFSELKRSNLHELLMIE